MVVGMTAMRKKNVVIRDLSALEALGGVTNICSDKTGTLTQGAMIVKKVWLPKVGIYTVNHSLDPNDPTQGTVTRGPELNQQPPIDVMALDLDHQRSAAALKFDDSEVPIPESFATESPTLKFDIPAAKIEKDQQNSKRETSEEAIMTPELEAFLQPTALCNLATVALEKVNGADSGKWQTTGEPTEIALQVFAHRFDFGKRRLVQAGWKQIAEFPFDSGIKRMTVVYNQPGQANSLIFTKGAVERILDFCTSVGTGPNNEPMTNELGEHVINQMDELASQGQRVLAIASRTWKGDFSKEERSTNDNDLRSDVEKDLTLVGLVGIYDPPRDETKDAVRECSQAGIKVHMLTVG
jgi:Na+-exporting ATPase